MNLTNEIKTRLLSGLDDGTFDPQAEDIYTDVCETFDLEDTDDLYTEFTAEYDSVTESEWWNEATREKRADLWIDENIHDTDQRDFNREKMRTVTKYR